MQQERNPCTAPRFSLSGPKAIRICPSPTIPTTLVRIEISSCGVHSSSSSSSSCCCNCCCCCFACYGRSCGFAHRLPVTVCQFSLYGPRQSSLLQLSASRRLILGGGGDRIYHRVPSCGVGYETSRVVKERSNEERVGGRRKKVVQCVVLEESGGIWRSSRSVDAKAVLSLLSDEMDAELFSASVKKGASCSKWMDIEEKKKKTKVGGAESSKGMKRNLRSDLAERDSRHELESVVTESTEDCRSCGMKREKEQRKEGGKLKKETSGASSYCSVLSSGAFDSDPEKIKDDVSRRNSSVAYREDYSVRERNRMRKEEELKRNRVVVGGSETSRHKEFSSSNYSEWDWRKKSEKKLDEASIEETRSRKEASQAQHRLSRTHEQEDHQKASTSRRQFTGVDEKLDVSVKVDSGERNSYNQKENVIVGTEKSADVCGVCGSDVTLSSQSREQLGVRKENVTASDDFVVHDNDDSRRARRYPQHVSGGVKIEEMDSETAAELQRVSDKTKISDRQKNRSSTSTSAQNIRQEKNSKSDEQMITQTDARRSQKLVELSVSHENIEGSYITTRQHREKNSNLVSTSVSGLREQYTQTAQEETFRTKHSKDESTELTSKLSHQTREGETALSSQRTSEKKTTDGSNNITVVVNVGERVGRGRGESSQMAMQTGSQNEGRMLSKVISSPANVPRLIPRVENRAGEDKGSLALRSTTHPFKEQASAYMGQTSLTEFQESKFSGVISPELKPEVESGGGRDDIYGTPIDLPAHDDVLESVHHSDQLYSQVLGEFIEKARHEVLSSEIQTKTSDTQLIDTRQEQLEASSGHYGSFVQIKGTGSSSSSQGAGTKGPSDEIWLEREASALEPLKVEEEPPEGTGVSGQTIVRRTGRSLWNIIADVVRLSWSSRSQRPRSAHGSRRKTSSNESVSSEAWFSGLEQGSTPIETIPTFPKIQSTGASVKSLAESSPGDKYRLLEESGSSPLTSGSSSASKAASSAYIQEGSGLNEGVMQLESSDTPTSIDLVKPSASRVALEAEVETGAVELSIGGSSERMEAPVSTLMMVSGTGGEGGLMKQRKFQRARQVPRDRFDEWEEAYQFESEQRRIDELFMREALLEAKKAADKWEVPAGAVLVQEGKIIARGCNLVEELRDSTAHAEIICIREASNALRSWRLANTTLYVTLEPCPMCAGAILQARVDTLVWGAPNKLLGADGSWIRLFPTGDESGSSETIEKPPPPVHPFHPNMKIRRAVLASECADAMQHFFQLRRRKKETKPEEPPTRPSRLHVATHPSKLLNKLLHITFCS